MRLRRIDSFRKLSALPAHLQKWTHTSKPLHIAIEGFVEDLARDHGAALKPILEAVLRPAVASSSSAFGTAAGAGASSAASADITMPQQLPHVLHQHYLAFTVLFEDLLTRELRDGCGVTETEFQAVMEIAALEERRDGLHFYRWLNLLDLDCFVKMLIVGMKLDEQAAGPSPTIASAYCAIATSLGGGALSPANLARVEFPVVTIALQYVGKMSDLARALRRRRTCLKPLIFSWSPPDFESVLKMIEASMPVSPSSSASSTVVGAAAGKTAPLALFTPPRLQLKELARWRARLLTKQLNSQGVYEKPPRCEADWLRYLEMLCETMPEDAFTAFIANMNTFVTRDCDSRSAEETAAMGERRAVFALFSKFDATFLNRVDLTDWLSEVASPEVAELLFAQPPIAAGKAQPKADEAEVGDDNSASQNENATKAPPASASRGIDKALQKLSLRLTAEYKTNHGNDGYASEMAERRKRRGSMALPSSLSGDQLKPSLSKGSITPEESLAASAGGESMCALDAPLALGEFARVVLVTYQHSSKTFRESYDVAAMCSKILSLIKEE